MAHSPTRAAPASAAVVAEPWRDKEIHFDLPQRSAALGPGEVIIDSLDDVEDTQGNNGITGVLILTNLRLIWRALKRSSINLSVGLHTITNIDVKVTNSNLQGRVYALWVLARSQQTRFRFIFTHLQESNPRLFAMVPTVFQAYDTSRFYRDIRIRSTLILSDKKLHPLRYEEIADTLDGVWNLSGEKGESGSMFVTNIRTVWYSDVDERFNVSLPYNQVREVQLRRTKFGLVVVLRCTKQAGSLKVGFLVEPEDRLRAVAKRIEKLHAAYHAAPIYGVDVAVQQQGKSSSATVMMAPETTAADIDGTEDAAPEPQRNLLAVYFADGQAHGGNREPVYNEELGLAIEPLPPGVSLQQLWAVE